MVPILGSPIRLEGFTGSLQPWSRWLLSLITYLPMNTSYLGRSVLRVTQVPRPGGKNQRELDRSLRRLPLKPDDIARGLYLHRNRVEQNNMQDTFFSVAEALSHQALQTFLCHSETHAKGPCCFPARLSLCFGNELVRERVVVHAEVFNHHGQLGLSNSDTLCRHGFPTSFDTRHHLIKSTGDTLVIIGRSASRQDFVLWIKKVE